MKRLFAFFSAAVICFALTLAISYSTRTATARTDKCDNCVAKCGQREEECYAKHGFDEIRCADKKNECVVQCFKNLCEQ